jgi:hypothetical protein
MLAVLASGSVVSDMGTIIVMAILPITHRGITIIVSLLLRIEITIDLIMAISVVHILEAMVTGIMAMHSIPDKDITHLIMIDAITTSQGTVETG